MANFFYFLLPIGAIIILLIALKIDYKKQALTVSFAVTMVINMFTVFKLTWYGILCSVTIPLAVIYVIICLFFSMKEGKK